MSRGRSEGQLFVGRLSKNTRTRDLEDIFESYGRLARCDIKYGAEMAYAFVDYEDRRDAEDAIKYENGRDICGSSIIVEWAKGNPRRPMVGSRDQGPGTYQGSLQGKKGYDECYKCHRVGHWARDCPDDRFYGYRRPRARSPSPRRRRSSRRSRSRSRSRHRSRSRSRTRSPRKSNRRSRSRSHSRDRKRTRKSRTHSRSKSPSKSPRRSPSRSRSPSKSRNEDVIENGGRDNMNVVDEVGDD